MSVNLYRFVFSQQEYVFFVQHKHVKIELTEPQMGENRAGHTVKGGRGKLHCSSDASTPKQINTVNKNISEGLQQG